MTVLKSFITVCRFLRQERKKRAVFEALSDMKSGEPMNRLLQGDVGSGKTLVAAALIYNAAKNGMQSAFMAPTEVLAEQHYRTLSKIFDGTDIKIVLFDRKQHG